MTAPRTLPGCPYPGCGAAPEVWDSSFDGWYVQCRAGGTDGGDHGDHHIHVWAKSRTGAIARWRRLAGAGKRKK